ncbi:uncharacterized protein LOC144547100 isoform X2 [Carex rostrata]
MGRKRKKTATGSRLNLNLNLNLTKEYHCANEDCIEEAVTSGGEEKEEKTPNCVESTKFQITPFQNQKHIEDYYPEPEGADTQLSWRPPMPIEDGIWKPILVKTNGEGRERLLCAEPLIEVYDVKVDLCGKTKTYGNIHGKIILDCMCYRTYLFNLDKQSALMIDKKGSLPLIGPDIAPIAYDPIMILVDLNIDDDKLCEDIIEWKPVNKRTNEWLYDKIKGRNGSIELTYVIMKDAWLAELDVKLIKSETKETTTSSRIHDTLFSARKLVTA